MQIRSGNKSPVTLFALACFALLALILAENFKEHHKQSYYDLKMEAAELSESSMQAVKRGGEKLGIAIDPENDPNLTGLIGQQYTLVTTDRGYLRSKLLATNPNFAAAFLTMFKRAGLKRGDHIAVALTGSLPGLNISCLAACQVMELKPVIITSVGASTWGANESEYTWLDMEELLFDEGLIGFRSMAASIGGGSDNGRGLSPEGRNLIVDAIERNDVRLIKSSSLEENIETRMTILKEFIGNKRYKAYVNIGGGLASLGSSQNGRLIPYGLNLSLANRNFPARGVINFMAESGIPVIHILQVDRLAERYGLSLNIIPNEEVGVGPLYYKEEYSITATVFVLIVLISVVFIFLRVDLGYYLKRRS
ncbi:MAG: poly-gamma-glutamate system protein [candidate division Zixibacteria bacterium]|nr:poly-gamma-glutamate system protein [candidate division Zixibacteria bacterium]